MKNIKLFIFIYIAFVFIHCGGTSTVGGTETGTTDAGNVDTSTVGAKVEALASVLVPSVTEAGVSASESKELNFLIDGTSAEWDTYLDATNSHVLTDIFGDADEEPQVVTKIRVLLDQFQSTLDDLFQIDSDFSCTGGSALTEGDNIEIAFFDEISNGTSDNRFFDCVNTSIPNETIIYGVDSDGTIRVASMTDSEEVNTQDTSTRGDTVKGLRVIYATYAETTTGDETTAYLDLQYNQATIYNGVDDSFDTTDDVVFKSRTRITGNAVLDEADNPEVGMGDFQVTKFDKGVNDDSSTFTIVTKTIGRGNFGAGEFSLFDIDSDVDDLASIPGTFCIQQPTDNSGKPLFADATNCTDLETAFAWGDSTFSFSLNPSREEVFEDKSFFEGNDTDLISNTGDNFTIPNYTTN